MKELYQEYDVKMQKTIEVVVSDFAGVRAGRANAAVLDKITTTNIFWHPATRFTVQN